MHAPECAPLHVPFGPPFGQSSDRFERCQLGALRASCQGRELCDPHVQLLEWPAEIADGVAEAAERATQTSAVTLQRLDHISDGIEDAQIELLDLRGAG